MSGVLKQNHIFCYGLIRTGYGLANESTAWLTELSFTSTTSPAPMSISGSKLARVGHRYRQNYSKTVRSSPRRIRSKVVVEWRESKAVKLTSPPGNKKDNVTIIYTPWSNLRKDASMATGQVSFHDQKVRSEKTCIGLTRGSLGGPRSTRSGFHLPLFSLFLLIPPQVNSIRWSRNYISQCV